MTRSIPNPDLTVIGRAERIMFNDAPAKLVPAKIDSGADISSVWASHIDEHDGVLTFKLFGPSSEFYTNETITLREGEFRQTRVANSFGSKERRYVVKLRVKINGRKLVSSFTLANRSQKVYPVLLGRKLLANKFLVDVSQGEPLLEEEKQRHVKMQVELSQHED